MKLLLCTVCSDVRKLRRDITRCACGASWGRYDADGHHAVYGGPARLLGLGNGSLTQALQATPHEDGADLVEWWRARPPEADCAPLVWVKPLQGDRYLYMGREGRPPEEKR